MPESLPGQVPIKSLAGAIRLIDDWIAEAGEQRRRADRAELDAARWQTRYQLAEYAALHHDMLAIEALEALAPGGGSGPPGLPESSLRDPEPVSGHSGAVCTPVLG